MKTFKFIAVILFAVLFAACTAIESSNTTTNSSYEPMQAPAERLPNMANTTVAPGTGGGGGGNDYAKVVNNPAAAQISEQQIQTAPVVERKIIRNADLSLEVSVPEEAQRKISSIADAKGGFVVESTQNSSSAKATRDVVTMTVRVPAEKFDETLGEIRRTAERVIVETVKGTDVTEEFIDIEARLKAKRSLEAQFLEIMKRADTVEDALSVQRQLSEVRAEIEKIEGRKRFLENQASLSTIKIRLQTPTAFTASSDGFFDRLKDSTGRGFDAALSFVLGFVTVLIAILPFLILIVLPVLLFLRYFWKRLRRRKSAVEIAREEIKDE